MVGLKIYNKKVTIKRYHLRTQVIMSESLTNQTSNLGERIKKFDYQQDIFSQIGSIHKMLESAQELDQSRFLYYTGILYSKGMRIIHGQEDKIPSFILKFTQSIAGIDDPKAWKLRQRYLNDIFKRMNIVGGDAGANINRNEEYYSEFEMVRNELLSSIEGINSNHAEKFRNKIEEFDQKAFDKKIWNHDHYTKQYRDHILQPQSTRLH